MGIHRITPESTIKNYLKDDLEKIDKVVIRALNRVGLECISEARNNGSYIDQTGNLRSSIGYAILRNGTVVKQSSFKKVKDGSLGKNSGRSFIQDLAGSYSKGLVLIVVAGMDYAAHVETRRNVLQSSQILAEQLVPILLGQLGFGRR